MFRLVDGDWDRELRTALEADRSEVLFVSPFIKRSALQQLMSDCWPGSMRVMTRFNLDDFCAGVSDLSALRLLLEHGAEIRGVKHLHAKLYLFGTNRAIGTSANLTRAALLRNHEFGFVSDTRDVVDSCRGYFQRLWERAGANLQVDRLLGWESQITERLLNGGLNGDSAALGDEGVDAGALPAPAVDASWEAEADQAFVKFFGTSRDRQERGASVRDEVLSSGSHWACTYPRGKRPRMVRDGALMFMARIVGEPGDIMVYGRAVGMQHVPTRDDASPDDIARRPWRTQWPHYVRVHHAQFVDTTLANCVSLNDLMDELGADAFRSTQEHARLNAGNTNPRRAYSQQASVELSRQGMAWLNGQFDKALAEYGSIPPAFLRGLDWPANHV